MYTLRISKGASDRSCSQLQQRFHYISRVENSRNKVAGVHLFIATTNYVLLAKYTDIFRESKPKTTDLHYENSWSHKMLLGFTQVEGKVVMDKTISTFGAKPALTNHRNQPLPFSKERKAAQRNEHALRGRFSL